MAVLQQLYQPLIVGWRHHHDIGERSDHHWTSDKPWSSATLTNRQRILMRRLLNAVGIDYDNNGRKRPRRNPYIQHLERGRGFDEAESPSEGSRSPCFMPWLLVGNIVEDTDGGRGRSMAAVTARSNDSGRSPPRSEFHVAAWHTYYVDAAIPSRTSSRSSTLLASDERLLMQTADGHRSDQRVVLWSSVVFGSVLFVTVLWTWICALHRTNKQANQPTNQLINQPISVASGLRHCDFDDPW